MQSEDLIKEDLKQAQLDRDEIKVSTLRLLLSEIHNLSIQKGELSDSDVLSVVQKEVKKRKEASEAFRAASRDDSADKEEAEMKILETYLPAQISPEELTKIIDETITELGASQMSDMGKVIGAVMGKVGAGADGGMVSSIVREKLS